MSKIKDRDLKGGVKLKKIAVAMSGGVDSTVAALILKSQGYEVIGTYFRMSDNIPFENTERKLKTLCEELGIELHILDLREAFRKEVIEYFKKGYEHGLTPNPCAVCNRKIKLSYLKKFAKDIGAYQWATGHYAKVKNGRIFIAKDKRKDQSYFLALVEKDALKGLNLPLGEYTKTEVRKIAREHSLAVKESPESQDICFALNGLKNFFDSEGVNTKPGLLLDEKGNVLGKHQGYQLYTLGQRKGLGVAIGKRVYVIDVSPQDNIVILGNREKVFNLQFELDSVNFHMQMKSEFECECKVRSTAPHIRCRVKCGKTGVTVKTEKPVLAVPGQIAAFYDGEMLIGGGVISKRVHN